MADEVVEAVHAAFTAFNERRFADFAAHVAEDVVEIYPQSGERFEGRERQRAFHEAFANPPTFAIRDVRHCGDLAIVEADERYADGSVWKDVWVLELRDGLVARMTGYFGATFAAPDWRRPFRVSP